MQDNRSVTPLVVFLALLLFFSTVLTALTIATSFSPIALMGLMWSVGLAAVATLKFSGQSLSELGWSWGPAKHHLIAFALPIAYCVLAYGVAAAFGLVSFLEPGKIEALVQLEHLEVFPTSIGFVIALALLATVGMIQSMMTALGEEIGWRGFLTPRLTAMFGFLFGTLLTGALWGAWHLPLILLSNYNGGGDIRFELISFSVGVLALSGPLAWLRLDARSLWPCATLHASHNLFVQGIFDRLTTRGASEITMVGEFGVVFAGAIFLLCLPFWIIGTRQRDSRDVA